MHSSALHHSFSISLASQYGIEEAILIHHFQYWINHNKKLKRNLHEGRYWMYQTREEIAAHFPYWNSEKVRRYVDSLVEKGIIIKGNFNKTPFDKTVWYAFKDEDSFLIYDNSNNSNDGQICQIDRQKCQIRSGKNAQPIPDTKTNTKTHIQEEPPPTPLKGGEAPKVALCAYGPHIKLKKEDYENFCREYGEQNIHLLFEEINDWIASGRGKPYKDFAAGIRTWIRKREWKKAEVTETKVYKEHPKKVMSEAEKRSQENQEWLLRFMFSNEKYKEIYMTQGMAVMKGDYIEFPSLPEARYYFDSKGFRSGVDSAMRKLTPILTL